VRFVFLTFVEAEGAPIVWDDTAVKSPELIAAGIAAGFSEREVRESPLGMCEQDWMLGGLQFPRGTRAFLGTNGSTLLEQPSDLDSTGTK
jgi:hypothetical protein